LFTSKSIAPNRDQELAQQLRFTGRGDIELEIRTADRCLAQGFQRGLLAFGSWRQPMTPNCSI